VPPGTSNDSLGNAVQHQTSAYIVLNLTSGATSSLQQIGDLATNPVYRDSLMVFTRVPAGQGQIGSPTSEIGHQPGETLSTATVSEFLIGTFEVTQLQWNRLRPDLAVTSPGAQPVTGIALQALQAAGTSMAQLGAAHGFTLLLPSEIQWEYACRAGSTTAFAWGDGMDAATVSQYAVIAQASGTLLSGPLAVGSLAPNAFGIYDMEGNASELTATGSVRGGSWHDATLVARSANHQSLDPGFGHPLVGFRLVLVLSQ
jgi:formylglycine-generating enzyme required for sulfatase activity